MTKQNKQSKKQNSEQQTAIKAEHKRINKSELVDLVADKNPYLKKSDIRSVLDGIVSTIQEQTTQGNEIVLVGFGGFKIVERSARQGRNPKTGEVFNIPASTHVVAKLSSSWAKIK